MSKDLQATYHTISIQSIFQAEDTQGIISHITSFLKNAKDKELGIILPTAFMAEQFYKRFKDFMDSTQTQMYCFYNITLDSLHSNTYDTKHQSKSIHIEYLNQDTPNPLENFIQKVSKEAKKQREGKLKDTQKKLKKSYSFFDDLEELEYINLSVSDTMKADFDDRASSDSLGIRLIKEFFIELIEHVSKHYETYIEDKEIQGEKLRDIKTRLWKARNEILQNLSDTDRQKGDDETRAALLIALKVGIAILGVCFAIGSGGAFMLLALSIGSLSLAREIPEITQELQILQNNKYYRAIAIPILNTLFGDVAYAMALCMIEFRGFMLFDSDGNFLDLSGISTECLFAFQEKTFDYTPMCNQVIKGRYNGKMQDIIDTLKGDSFVRAEHNDFSYMSISPLNRNANTKSPSYELFDALQRSYVNLVYITHPIFSSNILANTIKSKNTTSQDHKNYVIIAPPPSKKQAGSTEAMMNTLGTRIEGRPEPPKPLYNDTQDYSAYIHKEDTNYDELFLQITPFVKIDQERKGDYKRVLSQADKDYIQTLMIQEQDIESIKEMQKNIMKETIAYYKQLFDSVHYETKSVNDDMVFGGVRYIYTLENILLKALILYCIEQEGVEITQGFWTKVIYAKTQEVEFEIRSRKTQFVVAYNQLFIPVDILDLKEQIKQAIQAYQENEINDCTIMLGGSLGNVAIMPFSQNAQKLSFAFANKMIEQDIQIDDTHIQQALPLMFQSIAQNILTNLLPTTKIFFADTESKKLEALSIIFVTFSFAFVYAIAKKKNFPQTSLAMLTGISSFTRMSEIITSATLEALGVAFNNKTTNIQFSKNLKKNEQILKLLQQIDIQNLKTHIKADRAGNKLIAKKEGEIIRLVVSYNDGTNSMQYITIQADETHKNTRIYKPLAADATKALGKAIVITIADIGLTRLIESSFGTNSKALLEQYKHLELKTKQLYNAPLVADRDTFFTYPMPIDSRMIIYNMSYGLFGGSLQNGGLEVAPSIMLYAALQSVIKDSGNVANQTRYTRAMVVNQILAFIIPDELRGGLQDASFYGTMLKKNLTASTLKKQYRIDMYNEVLKKDNAYENIKETYKLDEAQRNKQRILSNDAYIIIDSYNVCIDYLANILDNTPQTTQTRMFVQSLRNIAKNNILAIYEGVSENNMVKQPKIFGRIATTIILENGLYLG